MPTSAESTPSPDCPDHFEKRCVADSGAVFFPHSKPTYVEHEEERTLYA